MNIIMTGLDYSVAPIALREGLSFTRQRVEELNKILCQTDGVQGCVLLSTCNRTELYFSCDEGLAPAPGALLCSAAGVPYAPFVHAFVAREGDAAVRHLMEVASGLKSQIWGEDQILAQVKAAIVAARGAGAADPVLETLFRTAISAGKEMKTDVRLVGVPTSAAGQAVAVLETATGNLMGKRALVIGNGEMGRLAAKLLLERGCAVTVTLRTYHHGETLVPAGCTVAPYEGRYAAMEGMDILLSATASPHCTVLAEELAALVSPPPLMVDLAIPRDIQPQVGDLPGITLYNVDSLGGGGRRDIPPEAVAIVDKYITQLDQWDKYRACLPALERIKQAVVNRVVGVDLGAGESRELVELAVSRAVDLLSGGLKENLCPEDLEKCAQKIALRNAARPGRGAQGEPGFRFPLFINLAGQRVVVVGGGTVACRRAAVLQSFGGAVTIIAPACKALPVGVDWVQRPYAIGDLTGAVLAVAATDSRPVNRAVGEEARGLGIPVSVADCPEECSFFFPALCVGDGVVAGVVSHGENHALTARAAKAIRQTFAAEAL